MKLINTKKLNNDLANCHPKLSRGQVWCTKCGATQKVNSGKSLSSGWPLCCGETMTIDSPEERTAMNSIGKMR